MNNLKNFYVVGGLVAFLVLVGLTWNYTEAIKEKNTMQKSQIDQQWQMQQEKAAADAASARERKNCLNTADELARVSFQAVCEGDDRMNGGDITRCAKGDQQQAIVYMTSHFAMQKSTFNAILNKRQQDREECFKQYP